MTANEVVNGDDGRFSLLLARFSEALADGGDADPSADPALSTEMRQRLQRGLNCLRRLRQCPSSSAFVTLRYPPPCPPSQREQEGADAVVLPAGVRVPDAAACGQVGRFRLLRTLGHGGGGIVFLAFDPVLNRQAAVKIPRLESLLDGELRRRFVREARAAAALNHPNLVQVHEAGEANGLCYIVSAYCSGGSLAEWLEQQGAPPSVRLAAELTAELADAVGYIHKHGIYHRDIKPSNILLDPRDGRRGGELSFTPRLTDFGLAKMQDGQTDVTRSGVAMGTAPYMAPEQVMGRSRDIGPRTDVYGLGAVLYEMLTGRPPFKGASNAATLDQVQTQEPVRPRLLRPQLPRDLETICLKCLEKEPQRRYDGAAEAADDLRRFLAHEPIRARPAGAGRRLLKWIQRHPWAPAFVCCSCLAALIVGLWFQALTQEYHESLAAAMQQHEEGQQAIRQKQQLIRQYRYANGIRLAVQLLDGNRLEEMAEYLERHSYAAGTDDPRGFEWHYLHGLPHRCGATRSTKVLSWLGHRQGAEPREVWAAAFAYDDRTLASAGDDHVVRLWDAVSGRELSVLRGHQSLVTSLAFSPDGAWLASGSFDSAVPVKLWNLVFGTEAAVLVGHTRPVDCLAFSADSRFLATAGRDDTVRLWDLAARRPRDTLFVPKVESLTFTPNGRGLLLASDKQAAFLWDLEQRKISLDLSCHPRGHVAVAIAPDGQTIVTGDTAGILRFWDAHSGDMHIGNRHHSAEVNCLAFSPDGKTVASASFDGTVRLWQTVTGRELLTLSKCADRVRWVTFSPDGKALASARHDGRLTIYRVDANDPRP